MSVKFVIGRAGSGKTHWCLQEIVRACRADPLGKPVFWILPRQATFQAERQLACNREIAGYFRARVMSFEDLGRHVLSECGGAATGEISELGRRMILGHVLRNLQPKLQFFNQVALQPGMAAELDGTLAELERCGVAAADLANHRGKFANPSLDSKIHDLHLIYTAYTEFLGQERLDPLRRLADATESIQRSLSLRGADVYFDSFFDFTHRERQVLAALAKTCRQVFVTLALDPNHPSVRNPHTIPDELDLFHRSLNAYHRLWFTFNEKKIAVDEPLLLRSAPRFESDGLAHLERWDGQPGDSGAIRLVAADDRRAEVDAAARWISERVAGGLRYRDVAVLMRSEEEYRQLIDASFHEHGIPFFIDRRRTAAHHPLPRLIRAALAVARTHFARDAVISLLKTDLTDLNSQQADELENYVLQQGIDHGLWMPAQPWHARRRGLVEGDGTSPESIDARNAEGFRKRLIDPLIPFVRAATADSQTVRGMATAIFSLLDALNVRTKIVGWMDDARESGRLEELAEHKLVWDQISALFEEMVELLGDEPTNLADFQSLLDLALEDLQLAIAPPTVDQVLVGSVDRTRTPPLKGCVVLGLSEGQFPRLNPEGTIFTDSDRRALDREKIDLDPNTQRQLLDENFLAYMAFTRASQYLLLTRPKQSKPNQPVAPSPLWQRVLTTFPRLAEESGPTEEQLPLASIATPRQLLSGLMRWVREKDSTVADPESWRAVYQWLANRPPGEDALDRMRVKSWKALSYQNKAELEPEESGRLFAAPLSLSIRQIEDFRACPYRHFALHGLGLRPRQQKRTGPADLSHIYHHVLHQITQELIQSDLSWSDLDSVQTQEALTGLIEQAALKLNSELLLPTSRSKYLIDRINQTLRAVTESQRAAAGLGEFRPRWTNLPFGDEAVGSSSAAMPPLKIRTSTGQELSIHGKIDRIDTTPDGMATIFDYRLKVGALNPAAVYHGVTLRLLIDLLALRENGRHLSKEPLVPVAALAIGIQRQVKEADPADSPAVDDPKFHLQNKPRGILDFAVARRFDRDLSENWSDVVQVMVKRDGQMGYPNNSDAVETKQLSALLDHAQIQIGRLADGILAGRISVRPYKLGNSTPCAHCELNDLCRFDKSPKGYEHLVAMSRIEMLQRVSDE